MSHGIDAKRRVRTDAEKSDHTNDGADSDSREESRAGDLSLVLLPGTPPCATASPRGRRDLLTQEREALRLPRAQPPGLALRSLRGLAPLRLEHLVTQPAVTHAES